MTTLVEAAREVVQCSVPTNKRSQRGERLVPSVRIERLREALNALALAKVGKPDPDVVAHLGNPALRDQLDDLLNGFRFWRDHKTAAMELTTLDECFIRWVEHGQREDL